MLKNYIQITLRNLSRNPLYSFLNIGGLAVGLSVSILILLYVVHEYSYENFQSNGNRIFQVLDRIPFGESTMQVQAMSAQLGPRTQASRPDLVEANVRMRYAGRTVLKTVSNIHSFEDKLHFADAAFFKVFTYPLQKGNPATALTRVNTIVLSQALALKYFGNENPLGKTLTYDNKINLEVTGVLEEVPSNSTLQFEGLISFSTQKNLTPYDKGLEMQLGYSHVGAGAFNTYFLLTKAADKGNVEKLIKQLQSKDTPVKKGQPTEEFLLESFPDLHLKGLMVNHSQQYQNLFAGIAIAILLLALINYMNLTTARATQRAKEVGVRKVLGGLRSNLAMQFYTESVLVTLIGFALSLLLVEGLRPFFFDLLELQINASFLTTPLFLSLLLGLLVICTLLAGSYPALLLSSFAPAEVLKGTLSKLGGVNLRRTLTVFQFSISVGLIVCSLIVKNQLDFLRMQNVGLEKEGIVVLEIPKNMNTHYAAFKQELRRQSGIQSVAAASWPLYKSGVNMYYTQSPVTKKDVPFKVTDVDAAFFETMHVRWKKKPQRLDQGSVLILNESAVKEFGFTESPVGEKIGLGSNATEIAGVIEDFNLFSSKEKTEGLGITVVADTSSEIMNYGGCLYLKLATGTDVQKQLKNVESIFRTYENEYPFTYYFLDEAYDALYKTESKLGTMLTTFTSIAILIACLGLFGLATFAVETRRKEIGIRKVLGASLTSITLLLSKEFMKLVFIASALAFPLAWYFMQDWLKDYAVRIEIGWIAFATAGVLALLIAFVTVSSQAIRAAKADPVKSLKSE